MSAGLYRLSAQAAAHLDEILDWSEVQFHTAGRMRYTTLLVQAMQDVADDPRRVGVEWVGQPGRRIGLYHLRHSRKHVPDPSERVQEPRHAVVFRIGEVGTIEILGFLHDRMLRGRALRRIVKGSFPQEV